MTTEDQEMLEQLSDQNMLHMQQGEQLRYILEWLFKDTDMLVDGTTKAQVDKMTQFKKIELLERLWEHPDMIGHPMLRDIGQFVEEIKPHKDGFRTADDYESPSTELMLGQCLHCNWSQLIHYCPGNEESERQAVENLQQAHNDRGVCNNIITYS